MAQLSRIEWTNSTWNPVVGCSKVSAGCRNCYAERMASRLAGVARGAERRGVAAGRTGNYLSVLDGRGHGNGEVFLDHTAVEDPLRWRSPRMIFVNSMSDLFHERVPLSFIRRVFEVMARCPRHTFQVLTKRPEIAAEYSGLLPWAPNIWLGTSVEDARVLHRIGHLRGTGARLRFLSLEPLLGRIAQLPLAGIHWVIVGGESGPGARPMEVGWVRPIRDRCGARGVPFFFKQWGGVNKAATGRVLDGRAWDEMPMPGQRGRADVGIATA